MFSLLKNADSRSVVAWVTGVVASILILCLIMVSPVVGLADSGDFGRVLGGSGLAVLHPQETYEQLYFNYAHQYFGYGGFMLGGYVSSHVLLVALAGGIGRILNGDAFDIRVLGVVYSVLFVWALVLLVSHAPRLRSRLGTMFLAILLAACLLFVFGDIGYVAYFQSFFGEPFALVATLMTAASAIALASTAKPTGKLLLLFIIAALAVATSKIQNAPLGFAFAILAWRMSGLRTDMKWKRQAWMGVAVLLVGSILMIAVAPDRLKHTNLYQSIFFGVLKNSPNVAQDMKDLGIPEKYAVLAGTNYFQKDTAIPQKDPVLRREVLERLSHKDIAIYYLKHPSRFMQKLDRAAENSMFIRPYYLGNYDESAGKPPGTISYAYSGWSQWKLSHMPKNAVAYMILFLAYFAGLGFLWWRNPSRKLRLAVETLAVIALAAVFACIVPLIGDGEADLGKHLFMFNVCFDMMGISIVTGAFYGIAKLLGR
ncbi:hypothetical protein D7Z26_25780 [Cohnella endophytica]|uniref:Glycosyltransferase RgtA/B/C/D-like domain-containing protein n=1 Tax=Cohnella endophytica TaxID=2419778 RepID=A0A494X767_9BACL|nr:hypothetical protein [Cohnella endophytica]RKP45471.1 hypothetical protein D7Z26_25780 [Cohnella endophytica]